MIFLDTNILIYANGGEHALKPPCQRVLGSVSAGELQATTTPEAIQEFAHSFARRRGRSVSASVARHYAVLLAPLRLTDADHLGVGLDLWQNTERLDSFDAILAAVAMDSKDATLLSADRAFAEIPGLHHVYPDRAGVDGLLDIAAR